MCSIKPISKNLGVVGESVAIGYLTSKGYKVIQTNFRTHNVGEIDIVCKLGSLFVFVEVKTRSTIKYGLPEDSISYFKKRKLLRVITWYLTEKNIHNSTFRFDVISLLTVASHKFRLRHFKNVALSTLPYLSYLFGFAYY